METRLNKNSSVEITRKQYFKLKELGLDTKNEIYAGGQMINGYWSGKIYYLRYDLLHLLEQINNDE